MAVHGWRYSPTALPLGKCPGTHWFLAACLEVLEKKIVTALDGDRTQITRLSSPQLRHELTELTGVKKQRTRNANGGKNSKENRKEKFDKQAEIMSKRHKAKHTERRNEIKSAYEVQATLVDICLQKEERQRRLSSGWSTA
jgi:hypothetical protein